MVPGPWLTLSVKQSKHRQIKSLTEFVKSLVDTPGMAGMEGVRAFLESSTIHGLTYISTTKKCARLFWILVVKLLNVKTV